MRFSENDINNYTGIGIKVLDLKIESEFKESGINQTIHRLYLDFYIEVYVSFPLKIEVIPIKLKYLLSETIIVGEVPEQYTKINRFFDDITESEIDDIYDFGGQ